LAPLAQRLYVSAVYGNFSSPGVVRVGVLNGSVSCFFPFLIGEPPSLKDWLNEIVAWSTVFLGLWIRSFSGKSLRRLFMITPVSLRPFPPFACYSDRGSRGFKLLAGDLSCFFFFDGVHWSYYLAPFLHRASRSVVFLVRPQRRPGR